MNETIVVLVRSIIAFGTLLIFTRFLGKQQVSQITFFDYILGITIGSIAANLSSDITTDAWPYWVALFGWTIMVLIMQKVAVRWRQASVYIDGEPVIVIMNGEIMDEVMKKLRFRISDLQEQLREKGVFDIKEVQYAVVEKDGQLSILKKADNLPVTPSDMKIKATYRGMGTELIYDGVLVENNLKQVNKDQLWLQGQLEAKGYKDITEVFLAVIDATGELFLDGYKDKMENPVDITDFKGLK
ncbi:DUF421 domain-containing protein [Cytobacillus purgationiresistens]|uniref:Uncharacterized membrane protein YcaP (DUF421 family) n=1 Tax=Cytobacillus purgationiresistens TaxID=863449 RepID=A0ABU0AD14_9BACI|nr:DUF421 domain-containing protein [Cytobacillus purgationiresistens]MDQ0268323.1 uncharacterized membrane protein YcaP (DUF421 family) [Cytobacillus purgationiresistens]